MITELKDGQIFIFGSNLNGEHLGGAAKQAYEHFGAEWGVGEGLTGLSYAFPTLDKYMKPLNDFDFLIQISKLIKCCNIFSNLEFLLTKVGCGIAGFKEEDVKYKFSGFKLPSNLVLPGDWK